VRVDCNGARMNTEEEDLSAKLLIIERQANLVAEDLPVGANRTRIEHIGTTARLLRFRLNVVPSAILPQAVNEEQKDFAAKLDLIRTEASVVLRGLLPGVMRERLQHIACVAESVLLRLGGAKPSTP
jgi:hypothetical protein